MVMNRQQLYSNYTATIWTDSNYTATIQQLYSNYTATIQQLYEPTATIQQLYEPTATMLLEIKEIWGIFQIPRHLGKSPDSQIFTRYLGIWGWYIFSIYSLRNLGDIPDSQAFGKSLRFSKFQVFGEFRWFPGIWGLSQILVHIGNYPNSQVLGKFPI